MTDSMKRPCGSLRHLSLSEHAVASCLSMLATLFVLACFPEKVTARPCVPGSLTQALITGDTVTATTGLRYIDGLPGTGERTGWCRAVRLDYEAYVLGGGKFDSSRDAGIALTFVPGTGVVIDGLEQGVIAMNVGGTRRLIIPASLGFGTDERRDSNGNVIVPASSTLIYDIEILEVGR